MLKRTLTLLMVTAMLAAAAFAQDVNTRNDRWKEFNKFNFDKVDFSKTKLTRARLARLKNEDTVDDLALLRGVVFGKRGRIFKEHSIQDYLEKQAWYKPNKAFSNSVLTRIERANLDLIRIAEASKHSFLEPGDMRIWQAKLLVDDNLREYSPAELSILIAEIEALHGKTFTEEWLQKYFNERYWYQPNPAYSGEALNETERKNLERLTAEKEKGRKTAISIGDMENFQNTPLTEDKLAGLSMLELRILREEFWARRGKKFDAPGVRQYFEWRDWYKPAKDQKTVRLSRIEQQNVTLLESYEAKLRQRLSTDLLTDDALGELFAEDLRVLRNEIYARHGRVFKDVELQKYFAAQPWYVADPNFKDEMVSEIESQNLAKIRAAEESATSKFTLFEG
jgi:hypothetical protein